MTVRRHLIGLPASAPRPPGSDPEDPVAARFIRRAYSVASSSKQREHFELFLALVPSGEITPRLLPPGDRLWLGPKVTGMFTLREAPPEQNIVTVATGTGLAPYMSMLRTDLIGRAPADGGAAPRAAVLGPRLLP